MRDPVKGHCKQTGCVYMKESLFLIKRNDKLLLFPHMDRMAVKHRCIMIDPRMALEQVQEYDVKELYEKNHKNGSFNVLG